MILIQRFGSALNLNIHFHMLFLDGVYSSDSRPLRFRQTKAPSGIELTQLTHTIATRVGRYLERQGLLERDNGQPYLTSEALGGDDETPMRRHKLDARSGQRAIRRPRPHRYFPLV